MMSSIRSRKARGTSVLGRRCRLAGAAVAVPVIAAAAPTAGVLVTGQVVSAGKPVLARAVAQAGVPVLAAATPPRYFASIQQFSGFIPAGDGFGPLQVRRSGDAGLVAQDEQTLGAPVLAAYGDGRSLVIGLPRGSCGTQLYRLRVSGAGDPGPLRRLGRVMPGWVSSVTVSGNGQVIGYAIRGCQKGTAGYIGVTNLRTGRALRWSGVNIEGVSTGTVALNGQLSIPLTAP